MDVFPIKVFMLGVCIITGGAGGALGELSCDRRRICRVAVKEVVVIIHKKQSGPSRVLLAFFIGGLRT